MPTPIELVVVGQQRRGPGAEGDEDAGDEVVDVPPADADIAERSPAVPDPPGREANQREGAEEAGQEVEEDGLAAGGGAVAAHRDADRVDRRRRRRLDQDLGVASVALLRPPSQHAAELIGENRAGAPESDRGKPHRRPLRAGPTGPRPGPRPALDSGRQSQWSHSPEPIQTLEAPTNL
jgi:hypothetical protein